MTELNVYMGESSATLTRRERSRSPRYPTTEHTVTTRPGTIQDFGALVRARATGARYAFADRNMRLRATGVVHAVTDIEWLDGALIPAAKCGAATVGGPLADGVPTTEPVNCLRCLRGTPAYRRPRDHVPAQAAIPGLELIGLSAPVVAYSGPRAP